jgi:hypothetical protein
LLPGIGGRFLLNQPILRHDHRDFTRSRLRALQKFWVRG